jgi:hypothetical protein
MERSATKVGAASSCVIGGSSAEPESSQGLAAEPSMTQLEAAPTVRFEARIRFDPGGSCTS